MQLGSLEKIVAGPAASLCAGAPVEEDLADLLSDEPEARALLTQLVQEERYLDALRFLVYCLPQREIVWLACLSARRWAERVPTAEADTAALAAAERWVFEPSEDTRRTAYAASELTDYSTPGAIAALAAFYSGGSIAAANLPDTPAPVGVCARLVEGAVIIASTDEEEGAMTRHARQILEMGLDVAAGGSGRSPKA